VQAGFRREYPVAARLLEELIAASDAPPPEAFLLLGRSYHALGDFSRSITAFRDYLRLRPRSGLGFFFAGRSYLALKMPQKAIPLLKKALVLRPDDAQILSLLGISYLRGRRSREAVAYLQQAVQAVPDNPRIYRAYVNALLVRGIRLCRADDPDLGAQMLRFVLENGVDEPLPHLELGRVYREQGRLPEALEHYTRAVDLAPEDSSLRWYRASLLLALGSTAEARAELDRIRSLRQDTPDLSWNAELVDRFMIRSFLAEGEWRRAAEACRLVLHRQQGDATVHAMFAEALRNLGDDGSAGNHLQRAVELDPHRLELRYAQLMLAWDREDWPGLQQALAATRRLQGDPTLILRFEALLASRREGDDPAVIALVQEAIGTSGPVPELMFALAERYLRIGLGELAEPWYAKTRSVLPGHEPSYLGEIAALETRIAEGEAGAERRLLRTYGDYLDRWEDNRAIRRDRAVFLIRRASFAEAASDLEILLAWEPANPKLRRVLAYSYRKTGRYREAAVLLKSLLKEKPRDLPLLLEFAGCLERAGAAGYAAAVLENAQALFSDSSELTLALGKLRFAEKKTEAALDAFRKAAAQAPKDPRPYRWLARIYRKTGVAELAERYEAEANRREKS